MCKQYMENPHYVLCNLCGRIMHGKSNIVLFVIHVYKECMENQHYVVCYLRVRNRWTIHINLFDIYVTAVHWKSTLGCLSFMCKQYLENQLYVVCHLCVRNAWRINAICCMFFIYMYEKCRNQHHVECHLCVWERS